MEGTTLVFKERDLKWPWRDRLTPVEEEVATQEGEDEERTRIIRRKIRIAQADNEDDTSGLETPFVDAAGTLAPLERIRRQLARSFSRETAVKQNQCY